MIFNINIETVKTPLKLSYFANFTYFCIDPSLYNFKATLNKGLHSISTKIYISNSNISFYIQYLLNIRNMYFKIEKHQISRRFRASIDFT